MDIYKVLAAELFGVNYNDVTAEQRVRAKRTYLYYLYSR